MSSTLFLLHTRVQNHRLLHDDILCHLFFLFVSVFTTFQVTLKDGSTQIVVSDEVVTRWQPDQTTSLHCCQKGWLGTYSLFFVRNCKQFPPALSCDCLECVRACRVHVSRPYSRIFDLTENKMVCPEASLLRGLPTVVRILRWELVLECWLLRQSELWGHSVTAQSLISPGGWSQTEELRPVDN